MPLMDEATGTGGRWCPTTLNKRGHPVVSSLGKRDLGRECGPFGFAAAPRTTAVEAIR
jgi:hypothetical protein